MAKIFLAITVLLFLAACSGLYVPPAQTAPAVLPSSVPAILSPTPPFIPSATLTMTVLPLIVTVTEAPTATATATSTATVTRTPLLLLDISGCNTSLDITHMMGEITNAYPVIGNRSGVGLTNVCATLSASDEARLHPDKTACLASLPDGYQVTFKLTVDTGFKQDTSIRVDVTSNEGFTASLTRPSCTAIGLPGWVTDKVGVVEPIP